MPLSEDRKAQIAAESGGKVRLAINLVDLDRMLPEVRSILLGGKLDVAAGPIVVDPDRFGEVAVAFRCPPETAGAICDLIRSHDRDAGDHPTRVYVFRRAWRRLPADAVLTIVEDGKCLTNPEVFGYDGLPSIDSPRPVERVDVGRTVSGRSGVAK